MLKQHLKNDPLWGLLERREEALRSHIAHRAAIQKRLASLLEQETGYKLDDKSETPPPNLCSYTCGPLLYEATLRVALASPPRARLEDEIVANSQTGTVEARNLTLAAAPGDEEQCREGILAAYRKLLRSPLITQLKDSHEELERLTLKAGLAAEEIKAAGYIPGQCHICKRLGL
jgi:hypothetical protein